MLLNRTNGRVLADRLRIADSFLGRFRGLMLTGNLPEGAAIQLVPCNAIHTFLMRYAIDVLYADDNLRIVGIREHVQPNRFTGRIAGAGSVIELPAGTVRLTDTRVGHDLQIEHQTVQEKEC